MKSASWFDFFDADGLLYNEFSHPALFFFNFVSGHPFSLNTRSLVEDFISKIG
jgi:hypothetical protein